MRPISSVTVGILLAIASSGSARAPSGTTAPAIAYVRSSTSGNRQLIVANEDGSGAVTVYSSAGRLLNGQLGRDGFIYFFNGGNFYRMPALGGAATLLFETPGTISRPFALSRDGGSIAWFSKDAGMIMRFDLGRGQTPIASVAHVLDLTYDRLGSSIIFVEEVDSTGSEYQLKRVSAGGGTPSLIGLSGRISSVDSAHADDTLLLTFNPVGASPYLALWKPGMGSPMRLTDGYNGVYRCDDSAILYDRMASSGAALYRRTAAGAITLIAKPESVFPSYKPVC